MQNDSSQFVKCVRVLISSKFHYFLSERMENLFVINRFGSHQKNQHLSLSGSSSTLKEQFGFNSRLMQSNLSLKSFDSKRLVHLCKLKRALKISYRLKMARINLFFSKKKVEQWHSEKKFYHIGSNCVLRFLIMIQMREHRNFDSYRSSSPKRLSRRS